MYPIQELCGADRAVSSSGISQVMQAKSVTRLPCKCEDLNSDLWQPNKKPSIATGICDLNTGKAEAGGFWKLTGPRSLAKSGDPALYFEDSIVSTSTPWHFLPFQLSYLHSANQFNSDVNC